MLRPPCASADRPLPLPAHRLPSPRLPASLFLLDFRYLMEFPRHFAIEDLDLDGEAKVTLHKKLPSPTGGNKERRAGSSVTRVHPGSSSARAASGTTSAHDADAVLIELLTLKQQGEFFYVPLHFTRILLTI